MRKQPYPITQLTGGLNVNVDAVFLVDKESPDLRNVWFDKGLIKKGLGRREFGTGLPLDGCVMLIDSFPMYSGSIQHLIVTTKWVYKYNPANGTYTRKNTNAFTGDEDNQFSSVVTYDSSGNDLFILTNGVDNIQKWDGGTGNFVNLGGWGAGGVKAKRLAVFQSRLIAGFTVESGGNCPTRVRWSVAGNPEDITGTGSGFVDLVETPDWIVALTVLKGKFYVFKERSIWELVYVGGTDVFKPYPRIDGVGTYSPQSVINLGEEVVFFGSDNIYLYDGINVTPIGKNLYPYLYETQYKIVNSDKINRTAGVYIEELKSYQLCFPTEGDKPDLTAEYNFDAESWTLRSRETTAYGFYSVPGGTTWADLVGTWDAQTWTWMDRPLRSGAPTTLMGTSTGYVYEDDRLTTSTDTAYFQTKDFVFEHAQRWVEVRVLAKGGPFDLSYSLDRGASWSNPVTLPYSSEFTEYVVWINKTSQQIRFKIQTQAKTFELKWVEPWYIPRKRSTVLTSS